MDILNELLSVIDEVSIDRLAKQAVANWAKEAKGDSDILLSSVLTFRSHKFCFKSSTLESPYFETTYALVKGEVELGVYKIFTNFNGEPVDDDYEIYQAA